MAPLEPWEKVLISADFLTSVHGEATCVDCHGGQLSEDKDSAHTDLIADPSLDSKNCANCHEKESQNFDASLHASQAGYWTVLNARSVPENHPALETMFGNHCASCHTTCGDCHISQPDSVGGGLLDGHLFVQTPPMTRTCTACHGSRVGNEYLGKNEELPGDVHFRTARMNCVSCHTGAEMHDSQGADHRYSGEETPRCTDCHEVGGANDPIAQHAIHGDTLSCQVCHSITYTSCDGCHVSISETTGNPKFKTDGTYMTFLIGLNTRQSEERPYKYVPVRHIPVDPNNYDYYGENLLPNFGALPTWAYATPHNIQRNTPQNSSCNACHGNAEIFLTADKVRDWELEANQDVIVPEVPSTK